jgi:Kef-type K+ transport system membrane component KefB
VVGAVLLPVFFAFTGLRTSVGLVQGGSAWALTGLVLLVAVAGKLGGSAGAARLLGMPWREALAVGALMNTRGLMELVILNVGLDIGVITPTLFAMLVLMALVTTVMTSPLLTLLGRRGEAQAPGLDVTPAPRGARPSRP